MSTNKFVFGMGTTLVLITIIFLNIPSHIANAQEEIVVAEEPEEQTHLDLFDKLDFVAWNNNNWTLFKEIHSSDVLVVDFDGTITKGIDEHVKWAKESQESAPTTITVHPIKIAVGNWTAVTGNLTGTVLSTGETFNSTMITLAHWENGQIIEEYLFGN